MKHEDEDHDLYNDEDIEKLEEADELAPEEEGFMHGYNEGSDPSKCAYCRKFLGKKFVEEEIKEEVYRFCSDECAFKFERKIQHI